MGKGGYSRVLPDMEIDWLDERLLHIYAINRHGWGYSEDWSYGIG